MQEVQFSSVTQSCPTLCNTMECSMPGFPVHHQLSELMSIELVMPSNQLILCCPLLLPSIFPSTRVFSNESVLPIRWPKYWSFSFNISPPSEYPGLISFRMDCLRPKDTSCCIVYFVARFFSPDCVSKSSPCWYKRIELISLDFCIVFHHCVCQATPVLMDICIMPISFPLQRVLQWAYHMDVVMPIFRNSWGQWFSAWLQRKSPGSFYNHTGAPPPKVLNSFLKILRLSEILKDFNGLIRT